MRTRHVVAVSSLAIALPLAPISAQSTAPEPPKWSFSVGVEPMSLDLRTRDPGVDARMVANLTRSWQSANSRFARHISLMVGADAPRKFDRRGDPDCDGCWTNVSERYGALTAGASYDLFTVSRFTPYLKGGTGIYYTRLALRPTNGVVIASDPFSHYTRNDFSLGVNGGMGLKVRLWSRELFIEQVLHAFDVRRMDRGVYPFNIGLRF